MNQSDFKAKPLVSRFPSLTIVINNNSSAMRDMLLVTSENGPLIQSEDIITELPRPICFFPTLIKLTLFSNLNAYHLAKIIGANSHSIYLYHCHLVLKVLNSLLKFLFAFAFCFFCLLSLKAKREWSMYPLIWWEKTVSFHVFLRSQKTLLGWMGSGRLWLFMLLSRSVLIKHSSKTLLWPFFLLSHTGLTDRLRKW